MKYERAEATTIIARMKKSQTISCTWTAGLSTAMSTNVMSATPVTP